jgi:sec-independent protein translocase protein TatA
VRSAVLARAYRNFWEYKFARLVGRNKGPPIQIMSTTISNILNFAGPDIIVVLVIVLLLFGAKKLPELARGIGQVAKEFGAARDETAREFNQSGPKAARPPKLVDEKSEAPSAP